ncbi:MAG TPA: TIM barrel protein [Candidatus Udaeobacter sp.]|jgi:sugar phosphate isomerase/epimerase|nr:TIM barrel protein [Candidatus Udaeobacter sp.]
MLQEIKTELDFDFIELGHGTRLSLIPGIQKMFDAGQVRFSSLHNFCPLPVEVMVASPNCYQFSAPSTEERERAVKQTLQTIDFAARLHAPVVVLHLGEVNMRPVTEPLIELAKTGKHLSRRYVELKINAVKKREELAPVYLQRVKDCLFRIIEYAESKNVGIALESRRGYEEIPTERELTQLLAEIDCATVGYWHDFGHSQIKENLGFIDHVEWLQTVGPRAFGCHVQDCIWPAKDHEAPFTGEVKFEKLVPLLPANCLFVWEMSPNKTADVIRQSARTWRERFGE